MSSAVDPETQKPIVRQRGYQDPFEPWGAKFVRKFNENPLVPIGTYQPYPRLSPTTDPCIPTRLAGCILTCGALIMSAHKLRQGNSKQMNHWLRARVALQGVTIVALVAGSMQLKKFREAEQAISETAAQADVEREKQEFEKRLKEAERATSEEVGLVKPVKVRGLESAKEVDKRSSSWSSWLWSSRGKNLPDEANRRKE
jgi:hypothetical protein